MRHLFGKAHQIAIDSDQRKPADQRVRDEIPETSTKKQMKITTLLEKIAMDSY